MCWPKQQKGTDDTNNTNDTNDTNDTDDPDDTNGTNGTNSKIGTSDKNNTNNTNGTKSVCRQPVSITVAVSPFCHILDFSKRERIEGESKQSHRILLFACLIGKEYCRDVLR